MIKATAQPFSALSTSRTTRTIYETVMNFQSQQAARGRDRHVSSPSHIVSMADDEILPCITALYLTSSDEGDPDSEEEEWREALKAEVEEDIQRQVRLRLGLHSLLATPHCLSPPLHTAHTLTALPWQHGVGETEGHAEPVKPDGKSQSHAQLLPTRPCDSDHVRSQKRKQRRHIQFSLRPAVSSSLDHDALQKASEVVVEQSHRTTMQAAASVCRQSTSDRPVDVYEYLSAKYGIPIAQLKHLTKRGSYKTKAMACGDGGSIRWPIEANIAVPTPKHTATCSNSSVQEDRALANGDGCEGGEGVRRRGRQVYSCDGGGGGGGEGVLEFEARFESGNLQQALQVGPKEYQLVLRCDLYSSRHTQWFYFRVAGMESGAAYTFSIINLLKTDSLYNHGMQPLLYSEREVAMGNPGWSRVGYNIRYYRCPGYRYTCLPSDGEFYTLTWKMEFPHAEDVCYLAHCFPYPYSSLLSFLSSLTSDPQTCRHAHTQVLCETLAGNACHVTTVTDFASGPEVVASRPGVVVSARVHPGETNSSWMMEGLMEYLTSETHHARTLRSQYVFKLVPMLNPDGVVVGNYRTSLAGVDLNRVYKSPDRELFPTIFHTKALLEALREERELVVYIDLHGHSRKHNVFMYGCHLRNCDHTHFLNERVLPFLLSQQAPGMFSFDSCKFGVHRCKEATGRVVTWRLGVHNSFTLEASFAGTTLGTRRQFTTEDLKQMGRSVCEAIHRHHRFMNSKSYQQKVMSQLAEHLMKSVAQATPTDHAHQSGLPLPDIVTSSTPHTLTHHETTPTGQLGSRKQQSKQCKKTLHRFMKVAMGTLEAESSTSGSDSENDDITFKRKSRLKKQRKRCRSLHVQPPHPPHPPHPPSITGTETSNSQQAAISGPLPTEGSLAPLKLRCSAPARLQGGGVASRKAPPTAPGSWKFINRYANRSNGGIPMFSEERMKERAEKMRLQSASSSQAAAELSPLHSTTQQQQLASLLWQPVEPDANPRRLEPLRVQSHTVLPSSHPPPASHLHPSLPSHPPHPQLLPSHPPHPSLPSQRHHYQSIKGLVESRSRQTSRSNHQTSINKGRLLLGASPSMQGVNGGISPRLARYISEMWSKNSEQNK